MRAQYLDGHALARDERGLMHLSERGGSQRLSLECREDLANRCSDALFEHIGNVFERHRRHAVLERTELLGVLARQHVNANAQVLAKLDDETAEPLGNFSEPPRLTRVGPVLEPSLPARRAQAPARIEPPELQAKACEETHDASVAAPVHGYSFGLPASGVDRDASPSVGLAPAPSSALSSSSGPSPQDMPRRSRASLSRWLERDRSMSAKLSK